MLLKTYSLGALFGLFAILLVSCQLLPGTQPEDSPIKPQAGYINLSKGDLIIPAQGNCTLDSLEAREEGYRAEGGVGGLAVLDPNNPLSPTANPYNTGASYLASLGWPDGSDSFHELQYDVAILVLDDFKGHEIAGGVYKLGQDVFQLSNEALPSDPLEERVDELELIVDSLVEDGQLSHGALVLNHTLALVSSIPGVDIDEIGDTFVTFNRGDYKIRVQGVDTYDFNTEFIASELSTAVDDLNSEGFEHFAINMSFSIVPCSVLEDYQNALGYLDIQSFDKYIDALTNANCNGCDFNSLKQTIFRVATQPVDEDNDPLFNHDLVGSGQAVFSASAGNYGIQGLDYALAPAAWAHVISVSSEDVGLGTPSSFSNPAEIMIAGAWFNLTGAANFNEYFNEYPEISEVYYAGTSFAAPAISVFSAFDLVHTTPHCTPAQNPQNSAIPLLAYDAGQGISFDNLPLQEAILVYCQ